MAKHEEHQYLELVSDILKNGEEVTGRNGTTKVKIGSMMRFSLKDDSIPILTTKKTAWKTCLKELLWFISGNTSNKTLKAQNVHIWDANASLDFLHNERGLYEYKEDDLGPVYGFQWRHFNAEYNTCDSDYTSEGVDQLTALIADLRDPAKRYSRRHILTAWNPCQVDKMALPPCHLLCQFNVVDNKLSCCLYQRSGDIGLGVPFNIASYSFLTHIIAKLTGLMADEFIHFISNTHIYDDHYEPLAEQIKREPFPFPKIKINNINTSNTIDDVKLENIELLNYKYHEKVIMEMRK
jgi:thymidylate synthase